LLDLKLIRSSPEAVVEMLKKRGSDPSVVDEVLRLDQERRSLLVETEERKARRNAASEEIAALKRKGEDAAELVEQMRRLSEEIKGLDAQLAEVEAELNRLLLTIPNMLHPSVPPGDSDDDNVEVRRWGEQPTFDFPPRPHWEVGEALDILDFRRATRMSGARFTLLKGQGALLERVLISFMLDLHTREHGYVEFFPPLLVTEDAMTGTGQLPKFDQDLFRTREGLYLIPTAEVPVTNIHREEVLPFEKLPLHYTAYTPCFRYEAGSAGQESRGLIRQHQFNKVELVKIVAPESSYDELESLVADAEEVLKRLKIAYRVVSVCAAETGFACTKKYDIEAWMPGMGKYVEVSSCSSFEDFQARRAKMRFRRAAGSPPEFVHTLNGSGLAVGRTMAALLENYQQGDGSVLVPEALQSYMHGLKTITGG